MENLDTVHRQGRNRLYPSLTNPNWLVLRRRREIFRGWLGRLDSRTLDVLDVGGRLQPYRPLIEREVKSYVSIDLCHSPLVNIVGRGEQLPIAGNRFDLVICTQVLEYIREPVVLIAEIQRVLRSGGYLLLSAPAVFPWDSDHDFWRFMPGSLRWLLRSFREVEIEPEGSSIAGLFRSTSVCLVSVSPSLISKMLRFTLVPVLNIVAAAFELVLAPSNDRFSANFSVLAKK